MGHNLHAYASRSFAKLQKTFALVKVHLLVPYMCQFFLGTELEISECAHYQGNVWLENFQT